MVKETFKTFKNRHLIDGALNIVDPLRQRDVRVPLPTQFVHSTERNAALCQYQEMVNGLAVSELVFEKFRALSTVDLLLLRPQKGYESAFHHHFVCSRGRNSVLRQRLEVVNGLALSKLF